MDLLIHLHSPTLFSFLHQYICQWQLIDCSMNDASRKQFTCLTRFQIHIFRNLQHRRNSWPLPKASKGNKNHGKKRGQRPDSTCFSGELSPTIVCLGLFDLFRRKIQHLQWPSRVIYCTDRSFFRESWHYPDNLFHIGVCRDLRWVWSHVLQFQSQQAFHSTTSHPQFENMPTDQNIPQPSTTIPGMQSTVSHFTLYYYIKQ